MHIAVIGGGINGVMSAWLLRQRGHDVELFERGTLMGETSSASTKLLHGGLRYLEQGDVSQVYEGLHERAWWLANAPDLTRRVELFLPVYDTSPRGWLVLGVGLALYDLLAGKARLGEHRWWSVSNLPDRAQLLQRSGLRGAFSYFDAQMDDHALGLWAAGQAAEAGVLITEHTAVTRLATDGVLEANSRTERFDAIVNASGPWARQLLDDSGISSRTHLDLVRGSHLLVRRTLEAGFAVQLPSDKRLVFALPYHDQMLIGTTEYRQSLDEPIRCSAEEQQYLIDACNSFLRDPIGLDDVDSTFAGLRPLVDAGRSAHAQRRGAVIEREGRVVTVFGGKWTTSRALGNRVVRVVETIGHDT